MACRTDGGSGPTDSLSVPKPPVSATPVWRAVDSIWSGGAGRLLAQANRPSAVDSVLLGSLPVRFTYHAESGSLDLIIPFGTPRGTTSVTVFAGTTRSGIDIVVSVPTPTAEETRQLESVLDLSRRALPEFRRRAAIVSVEASLPELFDDIEAEMDSMAALLDVLAVLPPAERDTMATVFRSYGYPNLLADLEARLGATAGGPLPQTAAQFQAAFMPPTTHLRRIKGSYTRDRCELDQTTQFMGELGDALSLRNTMTDVFLENLRPGVLDARALLRAGTSLQYANWVAWMFQTDAKIQFARRLIPLPPGEGGSLTFAPAPFPTTDSSTLVPYVLVRHRGMPWEVFKEQVTSFTINDLLKRISGSWLQARKNLSQIQQQLLTSAPTLIGTIGSGEYDRMVKKTNDEIAKVDRQRPTPLEPFFMRWDGPVTVAPSASTEWTISNDAKPVFRLTKPVNAERTYTFSTTDALGSAVIDECVPQPALNPPEPFGRVYVTPDGKRIGLSVGAAVSLEQGSVTEVPVTVTNPWSYPIDVDLELIGPRPVGVTAELRESFVKVPANAAAKTGIRYIVQHGTRDAASPALLGIGVLARIGNIRTRCAVAAFGIDDIAFGFTQNDQLDVLITGARKNEAIRVEFGTLLAGAGSARAPQGVQALQEGENRVSIRLDRGRSFAYVRAVGGSGLHVRYQFATEGITTYTGKPMVDLGSSILSPRSDQNARAYFRQRAEPTTENLRETARLICEEFNGVGR